MHSKERNVLCFIKCLLSRIKACPYEKKRIKNTEIKMADFLTVPNTNLKINNATETSTKIINIGAIISGGKV